MYCRCGVHRVAWPYTVRDDLLTDTQDLQYLDASSILVPHFRVVAIDGSRRTSGACCAFGLCPYAPGCGVIHLSCTKIALSYS